MMNYEISSLSISIASTYNERPVIPICDVPSFCINNSIPIRPPTWCVEPRCAYQLQQIGSDRLFPISGKSFATVGRNAACDVVLINETASRCLLLSFYLKLVEHNCVYFFLYLKRLFWIEVNIHLKYHFFFLFFSILCLCLFLTHIPFFSILRCSGIILFVRASRFHAVVLFDSEDRAYLVDLNRPNGTFICSVPLKAYTPTLLTKKSLIKWVSLVLRAH